MPEVAPTTSVVEHAGVLITAAGVVVSFLMGILAWLVKRDIGRVDNQFDDVFAELESIREEQKKCREKFTKLRTEHDIYCGRCPHINHNDGGVK